MEVKKILVPFCGNNADEEAIKLACDLAKKSKAEVYVVYIIEVPRTLPLDAQIDFEMQRTEELLTQAEDIAADQDYEIETDLLQAREAGPGIVDEAMERKVDMIIMGIPYKKHLGIFNQGAASRYVLRESPCPVLLYREQIP